MGTNGIREVLKNLNGAQNAKALIGISQGKKMQELIKIEKKDIGDDLIDTVNARELHDFLGSKQQFSNWILNRIGQFEFVSNADFIQLNKYIYSNSKPRIEYHLSLDMAKELGMVENNSKGRELRKWFIARDKKLSVIESNLPQTFSEALQLAANQARQLEEQRSKVEFAEKVETSVNSISVAEFANLLSRDGFKIGQNTLFKWFYDNDYLIKSDRPYQTTLDRELVEVKKIVYKDNSEKGRTAHKVLITGKGQLYFTNILKKTKAVELGQTEF